jgi:hypothetical protein
MTLKYYTRATLAAEAGIGLSTLDRHVENGVCDIHKAKETEQGAGIRFNREKAARYIAWMKDRGKSARPRKP